MTEPLSQLATLMEPVARILLGEPNRGLSSKGELRYGTRGSMSVDLRKGTWFDHETNEGGGTLDLIERQTGLHEAERFEWLAQNTTYQDETKANGHDRGVGKLGRVAATYPYVDEAGNFLFEVVRFDPKDFRQRRRARPDDDPAKVHDGWVWSVTGIRPVPYRLPEISEAIATERTIFITEGEKDCDKCWTLGMPATTNAGGAGKWRTDLDPYFDGADVVIVPDYDPQKTHPKTKEPMFHPDGRPILPGQDHAQDIARHLAGVARRVRVLELWRSWPQMPLKGDVSNWFQAGGTTEQLYALADELPDWSPNQSPAEAPAASLLVLINIRAWQGVEPRGRRWIVRERIPDINVTLLTGQGGVGKTLLMQQLAVATVLGRDWIGEMPEFGPVLFLTAEDDEDELHFRYSRIAQYYGVDFNTLADNGLHLMSLAGRDATMAVADNRGIVKPTDLFARLERTAREIRPRWIALDTAADIFVVNERDRSQVRQCISLLRRICLDVQTAVILLAHPSLSGISSGTGLSGSTAWNNSVRSRLYLKNEKKQDQSGDDERDEDDAGARILEFMKSNYSALAAPIKLVWKDGLLVPEPTLATLAPVQRAALDRDASEIFMALLSRFNRQDLAVSRKEKSNNFAPTVFAEEPEAVGLHRSSAKRKFLLKQAMKSLLSHERILLGTGPKAVTKSRQNECLYAGGTLL
jgi:RecA-family ATPase